jgi:hypothetical protein
MNDPEVSDEHPKLCLVGYALNAKKLRKSEGSSAPGVKREWAGGGLADILQYSEVSGDDSVSISFAAWNPDIPPQNQPKFQVIIHKLTEDIEKEKEESKEKLASLNNYLSYYPDTRIVDPIESVRKVTSRLRTVEYLKNAQTPKGPFNQPKFLVVNPGMTNEDIVRELHDNEITYPIICKPFEACGTPNSHSMVIYVSFSFCSLLTISVLFFF